MDPIIVRIIQFFLSLSLLIVLHELGHFIPAKIFKTRVEKFYLFFDIKFSLFKKKIGETVYGIGWLPLGGYVKISGMIDESMDTEQMAQEPKPWEFRSKPAWQRLIIMVGGVTVNLILGFLIYMMILFVWGRSELKPEDLPSGFEVHEKLAPFGFQSGDMVLRVDGEPIDNAGNVARMLLLRNVKEIDVKRSSGVVETLAIPDSIGDYMFKNDVLRGGFVPRRLAVMDTVYQDYPGYAGGLRQGDLVKSIDGKEIKFLDEFSTTVKGSANQPLTMVVERDQRLDTLEVVPNEEGKLGVNSYSYADKIDLDNRKEYTLGEAISKGFSFGYWTLHDYVKQFKYVFTKKGASEVGGFGAIGKMFPPVWDWEGFWYTTALISIILAFMNILPIPALDGGHVTFLLYEMVTGRKPSDKFLEYAQMVGFFLLIALLLFANGNDVYKWLFK
ncbi:RIP metalloprotease RseP [Poritiphilus flavus]|uniref:Zinc metalloprotease n=1 Tax=Poritiphilus flavus TaxID=2697053 RepID=A0A6L9E825_9FLAO|nr:RIP metalloprotease RseP [Poritiphilus flavus]NAS10758.1 RIP metalloprotease RseP [Poritiphilus flavus]